jgi:hypothetical protein
LNILPNWYRSAGYKKHDVPAREAREAYREAGIYDAADDVC